MYYSYVGIEYVATSFSPTRTDLALKLLIKYASGLISIIVLNVTKGPAHNCMLDRSHNILNVTRGPLHNCILVLDRSPDISKETKGPMHNCIMNWSYDSNSFSLMQKQYCLVWGIPSSERCSIFLMMTHKHKCFSKSIASTFRFIVKFKQQHESKLHPNLVNAWSLNAVI